MAAIPSSSLQSNFKLLSPTVNVCSSKLLSVEATSASLTTTLMSVPISTNINILSAPSRGTSHLAFNSLVSVDRLQQQNHYSVGDHRTLQLALELSVAGVNESATVRSSSNPINDHKKSNSNINQHQLAHQQVIANSQQEQLKQKVDIGTNKSIQPTVSADATNDFNENNINGLTSNNTSRNSSITFNNILMSTPLPIEDRFKRSQNMTECVPVPSSEHVAEIVGRQGR